MGLIEPDAGCRVPVKPRRRVSIQVASLSSHPRPKSLDRFLDTTML